MKVNGIVNQWSYPEASERQLSRSLSTFAGEMAKKARSLTGGMRFDASDEEINDAESELEEYAAVLIAAIVATLPAMALTIYKFNSKQFLNVAKKADGGKNQSVILLGALGANANESWYREKSSQWRGSAEASILKLARDIISDWSQNLRVENVRNKTSQQIDEVLKQRYKVYTGWTVNRSRGIVSTWNSVLMRQRLDDAGVTHYFWHGKLDERERLQHVKWEGKRIEISDDHPFPGEPYGCRCWAVPDFSTSKQSQLIT